jgi:DNA-binding NarL/FixJ family response regulator
LAGAITARRLHGVFPVDGRPPCVLLGNLEPMAALGMSRLLGDLGVRVEAAESHPAAIMEQARSLDPDTVVLGMENASSRELAHAVVQRSPRTKVILWARDESQMEVFDGDPRLPRRVVPAKSDALLVELNAGYQAAEGA